MTDEDDTLDGELLVDLALAQPQIPAPEGLRSKVLTAVKIEKQAARVGFEEVQPGIRVLRAGVGKWARTPFAGITCQTMYVDPETRIATHFLRMEPGSTYPRHQHTAEEQCYVLEGEVYVGDLHLRPGDFERAAVGTTHDALTTHTGCTLLIIASQHDELVS